MENKKYVIYCRVSSREQGNSGLSLDSQLETCRRYVLSQDGEIIGEFFDVKSGRSRARVGLNNAIAVAKEHSAVLVFSKLDRMARDAEYAHALRNSGLELYFCDFPEINTLMFGILVSFAQYEAELGQKRTRDSLKVIKQRLERGEKHVSKKSGNVVEHLGRKKGEKGVPMSGVMSAVWKDRIRNDPQRRRQFLTICELKNRGETFDKIAETMNALGDLTPRGHQWTRGQVYSAFTTWGKHYAERD